MGRMCLGRINNETKRHAVQTNMCSTNVFFCIFSATAVGESVNALPTNLFHSSVPIQNGGAKQFKFAELAGAATDDESTGSAVN